MLTDRLNLPREVRERLAAQYDFDAPVPGLSVRVRNRLEESRFVAHAELRAAENGGIGVEGYAATWDIPYEVAGGPPWGWTETVVRGAVDRALTEAPDIRLLVNHDSLSAFGLPLARTASKTLTVASDKIGLRTEAPTLDPGDPVVQHVRSALGQGNADQMSWAFRVSRQEWDEDYTERRILEVSQVYDVSIVAYPANEATVVQLNSDDDLGETGMSVELARAIADQLRRQAS